MVCRTARLRYRFDQLEARPLDNGRLREPLRFEAMCPANDRDMWAIRPVLDLDTEVGKLGLDMVWAEITVAALAGSAFYGVVAMISYFLGGPLADRFCRR